MKKISLTAVCMTLSVIIVAVACAAGTLDDIRRKVGRTEKEGKVSATGSKGGIQIQSVSKGVVSGWAFDEGAGTRMVRCILVKFKVFKRGQVGLPYLACYLFDKERKEVKKLTSYLELTPSGSVEPTAQGVANGNRTNTIQFVYPNDLIFKYVIAIVGNDTDGVYAMTIPKGLNLDLFDFPEKKLMKLEKSETLPKKIE